MPYPNEHSCRLRDPDDFEEDSFRRTSRESDGKRYDVISGHLKGETTMTEQAYHYPKDIWSESEARAHCKEHDGILFEPASGEEDIEDFSEDCCGKRKNAQQKRSPIRCFEGSAQPHEPFWSWRDMVEGDPESEPEMELYGYISEYSWWEDEITPKKFKADLYKYGAGGPIRIRMNSYGGDVIAANIMNTIIRDYPNRVTVQIDGVAASAATVVALAGDVVRIQEGAYFMIHDPLVMFFLAMLNIEDLTRLASSLQSLKEGIVNIYETRTGLSRARLSKMMTDETWMDAQRSVDLGFVDEVIKAEKKQITLPENTAMVNALQNYAHVPPALKKAISEMNAPSALTDELQREAQSLSEKVTSILKKGD